MFRLFFLSLFLIASCLNARHLKLTLQKALELKKVKGFAKSRGGHAGYCVEVTLRNLTTDSLIILIEPGRRLNSVLDKNQDLLVVKENVMALKSGELKTVTVKAYCCQSHNYSPAKNSDYTLNQMADSALVKLAAWLNTRLYDTGTEQSAVWAISNQRPTGSITGPLDSLVKPLRKFVAGLKYEPEPWYTIVTKTFVFSNGSMTTYPQNLNGAFFYNSDSRVYATCYLLNEKGMPVCLIKSEWLEPGINRDYKLDIPLNGITDGKYTVELRTDEKILVKKEIEI